MKISKIILTGVQIMVGILLLSVLYYVIFALCFSTDTERRLEQENAYYHRILPQLEADVDMLEEELDYLKGKDALIYHEIFKASVPSPDGFSPKEGTEPADVMVSASRTEKNWEDIFKLLNTKGYVIPPVKSPLEDLDYVNVGSSTGERMNPFFKMPIRHDGVDLVAPYQAKVYTVAPGTVTKLQKSEGGLGNMVEITHPGGYKTRYACLDWALVAKGDRVRNGDCIGFVGNSGRSFSTHLHFELEKDGQIQDPVYWFFDCGNPSEYYNKLVMSAVSGQSLD